MTFSKNRLFFTSSSVILLLSLFLRFYNLGGIPSGFHADEASQGFNAYSLVKTGRDMYGQSFPIIFRANGSYQPAVYTYLATLPVYLLGNTILAVRIVSAVAGLGLVLVTFYLIRHWTEGSFHRRNLVALVSAAVVAVVPWAVHFSRIAVEANLGLAIFAIAMLFLLQSIKTPKRLLLASLFFGLSTHAYYSEKIIAPIFLFVSLWILRKYFKNKRWLMFGVLSIFVATQIPYIDVVRNGALTKRFTEVSYFSSGSLLISGGEFLKHYVAYYSPSNLFFHATENLGTIAPDLNVFYDWLFVPFLFGIRFLFKNKRTIIFKLLILILLIGPVPAAFTGDQFYPLRSLEFLWSVSLVTGLGIYSMWNFVLFRFVRWPFFMLLTFYSLLSLAVSYFVLFKYEGGGSEYVNLAGVLQKYRERSIEVDYSDRSWGEGVRLAYLLRASPEEIQNSLSSQMQTPYYSGYVNSGETFRIGNITVRPINWGQICGKMIAVGDEVSISSDQVKNHKLKLEFEVKDLADNAKLFGYSTSVSCN